MDGYYPPEIADKSYNATSPEMLHYMTYQQFPVDNSRPSPTDDTHYLDIADIGWIKRLFIGLIPLLVLGGAIGFRLKRKRQ